jgi:hypothetical protein
MANTAAGVVKRRLDAVGAAGSMLGAMLKKLIVLVVLAILAVIVVKKLQGSTV